MKDERDGGASFGTPVVMSAVDLLSSLNKDFSISVCAQKNIFVCELSLFFLFFLSKVFSDWLVLSCSRQTNVYFSSMQLVLQQQNLVKPIILKLCCYTLTF